MAMKLSNAQLKKLIASEKRKAQAQEERERLIREYKQLKGTTFGGPRITKAIKSIGKGAKSLQRGAVKYVELQEKAYKKYGKNKSTTKRKKSRSRSRTQEYDFFGGL